MTKPIPGPVPNPKSPRRKAPPGSCDCHYHVFGPAERYPYSPARGYTPPDCLLEDFLRMHAVLGLERSVIVQPSVYGTDNRCSIEAVERLGPDRARGVAVIDDRTSDAELDRMQRAGFRGARFNLVSKGALPIDLLEPTAKRLAERGWHVQLFVNGDVLAEMAARLQALPTEVVIDHMGHVDGHRGVDQPGFRALLGLLDSGRAWVKLSGAYRVDHGPAPWPLAAPIARALIAANPERCVWGTDWPHPDLHGPMPDDGDLLDALYDWVPDDTTLRRILVDNPARLYGF